MISRRTKLQLVVFCVITVVGVAFVGARYARLDRLVVDDSYTVVAHFAESGGAFAGAEVSYRGVRIGQVEKLVVTDAGVDIHLGIFKEHDSIPADTLAVVGNRSAVGEQYVELQPKVDDRPYLSDSSEIGQEDTRTPIATEKLLTDISTTVSSVDQESLQTVVTEMGLAFGGTGEDLQRLIDSGDSFLEVADENFEVTTDLIRDSNTVLRGQIASESALRGFARDMRLFSGTMVGADKDLRKLIDNGGATATQLRTFLEENEVDLASLINNLVTTGEVVVKNLDGVEQILAIYPYVVEGGFTVVAKDPASGLYNAHFGMVTTEHPPVCHRGYESTDTRPPQDGSNRPMNTSAHCAEPASQSNARGSQHAPPRAAAAYRAPVAAYDPETGELTWGEEAARLARPAGGVAPRSFGEESWKWLFLQPLTAR